MTHQHGGASVPAEPALPSSTPAWRLLLTLGAGGAVAGLLVAAVYGWTEPSIARHRALVMQAAIAEVLKKPARLDTLYLEGKALTKRPSAPAQDLERVFLGFDQQGQALGAAISAGEPGFSDVISIMFGYDAVTKTLLGVKIVSEKETPGLGDKIEAPAFLQQFAGIVAPVKAVKKKSGSNPSEFDAISGATISSRAVARIINNAVARWQPLLAAYRSGGAP